MSLLALAETTVPLIAPPIAVTVERPRVAIIDSGVARTAELAPLVSAEYDMASETRRPEFQPRYDHGTMVATILARAANRQVDIISLRIDDPAGCPAGANPPCQPSAEPVARAIRRATELRVDAINISLALDRDPTITAAIADAAAKGIRVILAAGNNGYDHPGNLDPARAAYPNAVLVGAIDAEGQPWSGTNRPDAKPEGYNYAWALGVKVPTAAIDGRAVTGTGTSFAAPLETARFLTSRTMAGVVAGK
ncbi:S8/S53 family peptidase [Sphingomonas sp. HF-S4]|uniref:S8/S53 family peptidase n=1 Tax=Sphingomonas agrestis TaxID=3080540 RepID=A0ABU3Y992_9SPHN|nr:S8/S53 family peptidase [Sphingomonas sp. HF-S4]MDV3457956.1 S8/S53 family peptidase [Sphingomonas sp. HF-S4]